MHTANDLAARFSVNVKTIYKWHRLEILPEALLIGRTLRWREEDIAKWEEYLAVRVSAKKSGEDPDNPDGPAPPVYSTGCDVMDPRKVLAQRREDARRRAMAPPAVETSEVIYGEAKPCEQSKS